MGLKMLLDEKGYEKMAKSKLVKANQKIAEAVVVVPDPRGRDRRGGQGAPEGRKEVRGIKNRGDLL